jgi:hypothetical protein
VVSFPGTQKGARSFMIRTPRIYALSINYYYLLFGQ